MLDTKQVEVYGNVTMRQKKPRDGAPSKRISCIELGEADCEGWLTKRSTYLTPRAGCSKGG